MNSVRIAISLALALQQVAAIVTNYGLDAVFVHLQKLN